MSENDQERQGSVSGTKLSNDLTWSLYPGQAPASCFGWWWRAGVQPKSKHCSLFELLRKKKTLCKCFTAKLQNKVLWKVKGANILTCCVCRASGRKTVENVDWICLGFWSCFTVRPWWAQSYMVELRSILPGDSCRHRHLSISSVTLSPLVSFCLSPPNVFDLLHFWVVKAATSQTWPLPWLVNTDTYPYSLKKKSLSFLFLYLYVKHRTNNAWIWTMIELCINITT